jgi:hypothetical protein
MSESNKANARNPELMKKVIAAATLGGALPRGVGARTAQSAPYPAVTGGTNAGTPPRPKLCPPVIAAALLLGLLAVISTVGLAAPAQASAQQDQDFYWLLTEPDQSHPMVIWDFRLVRSQGIAACQRQDAGETSYQATKDLEYPDGPYTFEDVSSIKSSAAVIYCPWHLSSATGNSGNVSRPIYPRPVYPPLAWYPQPGYYPLPGGSSA